MRKRSEVIRKRSEVDTPKSSAEERTLPIPGTEKPSSIQKCGACGDDFDLKEAKQRTDGKYECSHCGAALDTGGPAPPPQPDKKPASTELKDPHRKYCGECASEWPIVDGPRGKHFVINCGHTTAIRVAHPDEAKRNAPPAGLQTRSLDVPKPSSDRSDEPRPGGGSRATMPKDNAKADYGFNTSPPAPKVVIEGNRMSVLWGKSTFPLGMMSNFTVGDVFLSTELPEGANRVAEAKKIIADLKEIADHAFNVQSKWYLEKLGSLK